MATYCPNCGSSTTTFRVCDRCGKVFCEFCNKKIKGPFYSGCPRCGSSNFKYVSKWSDMWAAMKNSQN